MNSLFLSAEMSIVLLLLSVHVVCIAAACLCAVIFSPASPTLTTA